MNIDFGTSMRVGLCKVELYLPHCHSLKEKRHSLRKIKDRVFARYKVSIHEVSHQDKWQRTQMGLAVVSNDGQFVHSQIDKILSEIEMIGEGEIVDSLVEVLSF